MKVDMCEIGPFRLPGIQFDKVEWTQDELEKIKEWSKENHCGIPVSDTLWSFRTEAKRTWFLLRWC